MEFRQHYRIKNSGFTLMEVLLVVGIVAALAAYGWVSLAQSQTRTAATRAGEEMAGAVREIQNWAMTSHAGRGWGLRCDSGIPTSFSYTETQPLLDQTIIPMRSGFSCTMDPAEIRFSKLTGTPLGAPANLEVYYNGQAVKRIEINSPGIITLKSI
ncbi:MAG: type II secretion system protein [Patescibacteria group bacterium]|jgi:prepilin-type N-terminal cleavage/methylation domain-containing protein